jgi:hypothetical protein
VDFSSLEGGILGCPSPACIIPYNLPYVSQTPPIVIPLDLIASIASEEEHNSLSGM